MPTSMKCAIAILLWSLSTAALAQTPDSAPTFAPVPARPAAGESTAAGDGTPADKEPALDTFINVYQPYARNISYYRPMYFLVGTDPKNSKFQVSFKYRFFNPDQPLAQNHPWVDGIHFAYTQTSFWDLASASEPFEDTSYKPELFYQTGNIDTGLPWLSGFFLQSGFQHESNGRGGEESRSTNFIYAEPSFIFMNKKELTGLKVSPRFWVYAFNDNENNPDLADYRGYFDLQLTFGKANSLICDTYLGLAAEGGSATVDLTYPLHRLFKNNIDLYLQVEYVNALAESLLHYKERTEAVRIGFAIVR